MAGSSAATPLGTRDDHPGIRVPSGDSSGRECLAERSLHRQRVVSSVTDAQGQVMSRSEPNRNAALQDAPALPLGAQVPLLTDDFLHSLRALWLAAVALAPGPQTMPDAATFLPFEVADATPTENRTFRRLFLRQVAGTAQALEMVPEGFERCSISGARARAHRACPDP